MYEARSGTVRLYVEDAKPTQGDFTPLRSATGGELSVGRGIRDGGWGDYLPGEVTSVRLWAGAMTKNQIFDRILSA